MSVDEGDFLAVLSTVPELGLIYCWRYDAKEDTEMFGFKTKGKIGFLASNIINYEFTVAISYTVNTRIQGIPNTRDLALI